MRILSIPRAEQAYTEEKADTGGDKTGGHRAPGHGHKRLAIEAGEDPYNNPIEYILESIKTIYSIKHKNGAIRRVNVNIAATTVEEYKMLKEAGIGTYILFQETYNKKSYEELHPSGPKSDYALSEYRSHGQSHGGRHRRRGLWRALRSGKL